MVSAEKRQRVFPLVVGQLPDSAAIGMYREQFAVGLRAAVVQKRLVLPAHAGTVENDPLAAGRPHPVGVVAASLGELPQTGTVGADGVNFEIATAEAGEIDEIARGFAYHCEVLSQERILGLVGRIYDAAADPGLWAAFLDDLAAALNGTMTCTGEELIEPDQVRKTEYHNGYAVAKD
ncbi:MAG: hypothetical protein ACRETL_06715, partial [Gammaproteobacteria bacterium]